MSTGKDKSNGAVRAATLSLVAALAAHASFGYDWPTSGTATLTAADCDAAGEVVVTDADYAQANGLDGISVGAGVKLVFNTTFAPTVALSGTGGTFVKRGDAEWTLTTSQANFNGDWVLEGGVTIADVKSTTAFGANLGSYALHVRAGASFTVSKAALTTWGLQNRNLHLAGTGYQNRGAFYTPGNTSTKAWKNFTLDDDATIRLDGGYLFDSGTTYEFNGHTLTVLGSKYFYFMSGSPRNGRIVVGDGTDKPILCFRNSFVTTDTEFETVLNNGSTLSWYNETAAYHGKITVNGAVKMIHTHQNSSDICVDDDSTVCLAGPVNLARADSVLTCSISEQPDQACNPHLMKISGYVYGPGGLTVDSSGSCAKTVVLSCPTNAFTGPVTVTAGELRLPDHGAIPDYAKLSVSNGAAVIAVLPAEGEAWTEEKLADLGKATCADTAVCVVDRSARMETDAIVYAAADLEAASAPDKPATLRIGALPADTVISVTGNFTKAFQPVAWGGNTVAVAGAVPQLKSICVDTGTAIFSGTLAVTNAGTTTLDYPYYIGTRGGARDLIFRNTSVTMEGLRQAYSGSKDREDYCDNYTNNAIIVGSYDSARALAHPGRFTIGENCTVTARCMCSWGSGTKARQTQGAIVQTGGETCFLGSRNDSRASVWGYNAPCSVTLSGGTMTWQGFHQLGIGGADMGYSTFHQTGGEFTSCSFEPNGNCILDIGHGGAGKVSWLQTGGTAHCYGSILLPYSGDQKASLTLMGSNTLFIADSGISWGYGQDANPILTIRDGAVFQGYLRVSNKKANWYAEQGWWAVFSCYVDGGWIKGNSNPLGSAGCDSFMDPTSATSYGPTRIASAGAGLGIDTTRANARAYGPIHSASGNGVTGIEGGWTRLETDLVVTPLVEILGDGTNATAFALMDGGAITNILITNPGEDYTVATARVMTAMSASGEPAFSSFPCTLAPNVPGGLNVRGANTLTLVATNDYVGATRVLEGTLQLSYPDLISPESVLSVEGGTFNFAGHTNAFRAVGGTAGTIKGCPQPELEVETLLAGTTTNLVFNGLSLRVKGAFEISGAELLAGKGPAYATAVAFDEEAGIRLTGLEGLDPEKRGGYTVLSATGGLTGAKVLNEDELPPNWRLVVRGDSLRLAFKRGMVLIVR